MKRMENFGLSQIESVWTKERINKDLTELPEDFYEKSANYASEIRKEKQSSREIREELLEEELSYILEIIQEIYLLRITKIINNLYEKKNENLLEKERKTFEKIREKLDELREELMKPVLEKEVEMKPPDEKSNILVLLSSKIPEPITASDLNCYGPFRKGEVANLPLKSAELLIEQDLARRISIRNISDS